MANSVLSFVVKNQPDTMYALNNNTRNNSFLKKQIILQIIIRL